jgi:hypothetical protein
MEHIAQFIELNPLDVTYLLVVGFIGGLVSGFIGSGGAFVLTPAMMSMGVPGIIAVASNICHKFPKALVGSIKRAKYGQVDVKLGIVVGISAEAGVLYGAHVQEGIKRAFGDTGSNLYVSVAFVVVLAIVGSYVLWDAWRLRHSAHSGEEKVARLARWVQSVHIPGTMVYFKSLNARVSVLFTIPLGFATGMLAATIAVGGFIGVPGMHYILGAPSIMASATELVVAFVMGVGGTLKYAWSGLVDIRLAMIILAGSLFGIQLGAIGTTYVKPHMIKVVMDTIMVLVLLSRAIVIPVYLSDLDLIPKIEPHIAGGLKNVSFIILMAALTVGAAIIFSALWRGIRTHRLELAAPVAAIAGAHQLSPVGRFERFLIATDGWPKNAVPNCMPFRSWPPATKTRRSVNSCSRPNSIRRKRMSPTYSARPTRPVSTATPGSCRERAYTRKLSPKPRACMPISSSWGGAAGMGWPSTWWVMPRCGSSDTRRAACWSSRVPPESKAGISSWRWTDRAMATPRPRPPATWRSCVTAWSRRYR